MIRVRHYCTVHGVISCEWMLLLQLTMMYLSACEQVYITGRITIGAHECVRDPYQGNDRIHALQTNRHAAH